MLGTCRALLHGQDIAKGNILGVVQKQLATSVALVVFYVVAIRLQSTNGVQVFALVDERLLAGRQVSLSWRR